MSSHNQNVQVQYVYHCCLCIFDQITMAQEQKYLRKRSCFAPDTVIVHTTTPKMITENGTIRKRSPEWSNLKTMLFENAVF